MHPQKKSDSDYLSYMLRMWRKRDSNGRAGWCASLEEPGSRHTESIEDTSAMFAFLHSKLDIEEPGDNGQQEQQG